MSNNPKVSIVIPTYNRTDCLLAALESALAQTYQNIEIIVTDDNAGKPEIRIWVAKQMEKFPQVRLIQNQTNLGGGGNRNSGIMAATGDFIAFLDDDDYFEPSKIEKQLACYEQNKEKNPGLIYCYASSVNTNGKRLGAYRNDAEGVALFEHMITCIAGTSLWFVPKNVLLEVGMFEDTPCKQDSICLLKILKAGYGVYRVAEELIRYTEDNAGKISGTGLKNIEGLLLFREWCRGCFDKLTKEQIDRVELNFSKQLVTYYLINNKPDEARKEQKEMHKRKPFATKTLIAKLKCTFSKTYQTYIQNKNRK